MSTCIQCGQQFNCGMADVPATEPCWCTALPPLPPALLATAGDATRCFCPTCLLGLLDRHQNAECLFETCRERSEFGPRNAAVGEVRRVSQGRNQVAK